MFGLKDKKSDSLTILLEIQKLLKNYGYEVTTANINDNIQALSLVANIPPKKPTSLADIPALWIYR